MSKFLGPIHFLVYNKIQIQQGLVQKILALNGDLIPNLGEELDRRYGVSEMRPLEEVIDGGNIHGWLQSNVSQVEYKLAFSVKSLIEKDPHILDKIESIFMEEGKATSVGITNPPEAYKIISDSLLDGMPCDHANTVIEENDEKVVWRRNNCIHKNYWEEVGIDISIYYSLREAFLRGFLMDTTLVYEKVDSVTNMIRRETK
ncbi:MAG: hypothetical protein ACOH15_03270 [Acetobacterium sp.]